MARPRKYASEVRERAVRMVREHGPEHPSQWAAISSMASKFGCTAETLRKWVRQAERDSGHRGPLTTDERQRLKDLERDNRELRRANGQIDRPRLGRSRRVGGGAEAVHLQPQVFELKRRGGRYGRGRRFRRR